MSMDDTASNIALANQSLGLLGAAAITVGATTEQNYIYCALFFDDARDEILEAHKWNFAKKRAYAVQTTKPLFGYDNAFTKPTDCLRVWTVEQKPLAVFEVEGSLILTSEGSAPQDYDEDGVDYLAGQYILSDFTDTDLTYSVDTAFTSSDEETDLGTYCTALASDYQILEVEYVYQVTDVSTYPIWLRQCVVVNLAIKLASPIKQNEEAALSLQSLLYGSNKNIGYLDMARSYDGQEAGGTKFVTSTFINSRR